MIEEDRATAVQLESYDPPTKGNGEASTGMANMKRKSIKSNQQFDIAAKTSYPRLATFSSYFRQKTKEENGPHVFQKEKYTRIILGVARSVEGCGARIYASRTDSAYWICRIIHDDAYITKFAKVIGTKHAIELNNQLAAIYKNFKKVAVASTIGKSADDLIEMLTPNFIQVGKAQLAYGRLIQGYYNYKKKKSIEAYNRVIKTIDSHADDFLAILEVIYNSLPPQATLPILVKLLDEGNHAT